MKEIKTPVYNYVVRATCECGGEFEPTGVVLRSYPPQYPHKCNKCGKEEVFRKQFPYYAAEEIDVIKPVMD
jgi:hypothetical protein